LPVFGKSLSFPALYRALANEFAEETETFEMAIDLKPGGTVRVTISKTITRATARKTIERLFMGDKAVWLPIAKRSRNFKEIPKRRGGRVWTKRPNKVHPSLDRGAVATIKATPQHLRDLNSVAAFVQVKPA
jgi:hypothetical protein